MYNFRNKFFDLWLSKNEFSLYITCLKYTVYFTFGVEKNIDTFINNGSMVNWWDYYGKYTSCKEYSLDY